MVTLRRFVCALVGHAPPPGVTAAMSIRFHCDRCGQCVAGHLGRSR